MSGTVDYVKVVDLLVDTIKELNQPDLVPAADTKEPMVPMPIAPESREDDRRADAVGLLKALLHGLEGGAGAAAAAEHASAAQQWTFNLGDWFKSYNFAPIFSEGHLLTKYSRGSPYQSICSAKGVHTSISCF